MIASIGSFALITPREFISPAGAIVHPGNSLADIPRESVYSEPYRHFGKMGDTEKLMFSAVSLALKGISIPESTGIVCAVPNGSLTTDCAYMQSVNEQFPSPSLFAATLPSSLIAELAIPFTLRGPNRVLAGNDQSAVLLNALFLIERGCDFVVAGYVDPNPVHGSAAVILLQQTETHHTLHLDLQRKDSETIPDLFGSIIAELEGRKHFPAIKTRIGTFHIEESHGTTH